MSKLEMMYYYLALRDANKEDKALEVRAKLDQVLIKEDLLQPEFWEFLASGDYRSFYFEFILQNMTDLINGPNAMWVNSYLVKNFTDTIKQIVRFPQDHRR